jgi:Fis family transcriptional regulator
MNPEALPSVTRLEGTDNVEPLRGYVKTILQKYFHDLNGHAPTELYRMVIQEVEQPLLEAVLHYTRGNQSKAAELLGINRGTLRNKLKQYDLD